MGGNGVLGVTREWFIYQVSDGGILGVRGGGAYYQHEGSNGDSSGHRASCRAMVLILFDSSGVPNLPELH